MEIHLYKTIVYFLNVALYKFVSSSEAVHQDESRQERPCWHWLSRNVSAVALAENASPGGMVLGQELVSGGSLHMCPEAGPQPTALMRSDSCGAAKRGLSPSLLFCRWRPGSRSPPWAGAQLLGRC